MQRATESLVNGFCLLAAGPAPAGEPGAGFAAMDRVLPPRNASPMLALTVLTVVLTVAVYIELKERRIPNWLTLSGMGLGLLISYFHGQSALWSSLGGLAMGFGFLFIFYVFGGVGGGDVKLMGAAGALMGSAMIKPALFYTAVFGALIAVLMVVWRKDFWTRINWGLRRLAFWSKPLGAAPADAVPISVPYGVAIALGCVLAIIVKEGG